jgi:putative peptidoglycan lipid II flippase
MSVCAVLLYVLMPTIGPLLYPGFSAAAQETLITTVRILLLQPIILGVSNLCGAYVQSRGRFLLYALAPVLYNVGIILGVVLLYPLMGESGLAWGVVVGALLHLAVQLPFMREQHMLPTFTRVDVRLILGVVRVSIPRTITLSLQQVVMLILVALVSTYGPGGVTAFSFAWNLQAVPLALIGASYSVAAFPELARLRMLGDTAGFTALLHTTARRIIFWGLPILVLFIVLRTEIVRVVLGSGSFQEMSVRETGALLGLFTLSLVAQALSILIVRAYYATGRTATPLILTVLSSLLTIILALQVVGGTFSRVGEVLGGALGVGEGRYGVLLLALAFSLGTVLNTILLQTFFARTTAASLTRPLLMPSAQALIAALVGGGAAYLALGALDDMVSLSTLFGKLLPAIGAGLTGLFAWIAALVALKSEDARAVWAEVRARVDAPRT